MFSGQTVDERKKLRQALADKFPCQTTETIFANVAQKNAGFISFEDLRKYCAYAKVPFDSLVAMFSPYGVHGVTNVNKKQFVAFFEDELYTSQPVLPIPQSVNKDQAKLLKHIVDSVRKRTEPKLYQIWIFMVKYNPQGSDPNALRISSICKMAVELEMSNSPGDVVAALFSFFGKKIECISYEQFTRLIQTFW